MKIFYIYRHINPKTNEVFYIGKGTLKPNSSKFTKQYERAFSKSDRSLFWNNIFRKYGRLVEIVFESEIEEVVFNKERELIELYGRRDLSLGSLVNLTDGGDGASGRTMSEENKLFFSKLHKGKKLSEESINAIKKANTGRAKTDRELKLLSNANKGKNNSQYGKKGSEHPKFGFKETKETRRKKQLVQSNPLFVLIDGVRTDFECVYDCSLFLNCTPSNIRYADKKFKKGLEHKKGLFKNIYVEILNNNA